MAVVVWWWWLVLGGWGGRKRGLNELCFVGEGGAWAMAEHPDPDHDHDSDLTRQRGSGRRVQVQEWNTTLETLCAMLRVRPLTSASLEQVQRTVHVTRHPTLHSETCPS